jgi:hypothetical protein
LYTDPPPDSTVLCLDEHGPVAAKAYPGPAWCDDAHRPHFEPDYSRHGYCWAYGALDHRSGRVLLDTAERRNTTSWLAFLDRLEVFIPTGEVYLIVDALPLHWTMDTMLWNWGHPRFHFVAVPTKAAWLNLIEGYWKILNQRALAGRDFPDNDSLQRALHHATDAWNANPTPFCWGRPPTSTRMTKRTYVYRI